MTTGDSTADERRRKLHHDKSSCCGVVACCSDSLCCTVSSICSRVAWIQTCTLLLRPRKGNASRGNDDILLLFMVLNFVTNKTQRSTW